MYAQGWFCVRISPNLFHLMSRFSSLSSERKITRSKSQISLWVCSRPMPIGLFRLILTNSINMTFMSDFTLLFLDRNKENCHFFTSTYYDDEQWWVITVFAVCLMIWKYTHMHNEITYKNKMINREIFYALESNVQRIWWTPSLAQTIFHWNKN